MSAELVAALTRELPSARQLLGRLSEEAIRRDPATRKMLQEAIRGEKQILSAIARWLSDLDVAVG